jgi:hypothetical protein
MCALQRRTGPGNFAAAVVDGCLPLADPDAVKKFPTLVEFLTRVQWAPDQPRQKGSIFLFIEDGMWKCCCNDNDAELVAFVTKTALAELLPAVEKGLAGNTLDWRPSSRGKARKRS